MAECIYCGEETKLFDSGDPVCPTCCDLSPDKRAKRRADVQAGKDDKDNWRGARKDNQEYSR